MAATRAPAMTPVILAIDPGAKGGWCVRSDVWAAGAASSAEMRRAVCTGAVERARERDRPLVVVAERWTAGGARGHAQWVGLGGAWGRWAEALELAGVPATRIVRVYPQTWRKVLAGLPRRTGEQAKASAQLVARGLLKRECGSDEAEAACIALWAESASEVAEVAKRRSRKRRAG